MWRFKLALQQVCPQLSQPPQHTSDQSQPHKVRDEYRLRAIFQPTAPQPSWVAASARLQLRVTKSDPKIPPSLWIGGVKLDSHEPVAMGGYANIYKGQWERKAVALKRLRNFTVEEDGGHGRRQVSSSGPRHECLLTPLYDAANLP